MEELYIGYFGKGFKSVYSDYLNIIRNYVSSCSETFAINTFGLGFDDINKKLADCNYLVDKSFSFQENGITILVPLEEFWTDIKNYIPKSITKLAIPSSFIEMDPLFFSNFPNLDVLIISDYGNLYSENIKLIADNTSIKNIFYKGSFFDPYNSFQENGFTVLGSPYNCCLYGNTLYRNINEFDITSTIKDDSKFSVKIYCYDFDASSIERLYELVDDRLKKEVIVESKDSKYTIRFDNDKNSYQITVESDYTVSVSNIVDYMVKNGVSVSKIFWKIKDKNYYDKDISSLESVSKQVSLFINYDGSSLYSSYEEFKGLFESIKWYRKIINDSDLSSAEKVMFAFDILKTFNYKESDNDLLDSRYPHRIIETGNIVCVGYSNLMIQILNYLDDNIKVCEYALDSLGSDNKLHGHSRNLVKLDDDKYSIHGVFAIDATWDSDKSNTIYDNLADVYTPLDLYRYFLVPASEYVNIFPNDTLPNLFNCYLDRSFDELGVIEEYIKLFNKDYDGKYLDKENSDKDKNYIFADALFMIDKMINDRNNTNECIRSDTDEELKEYLSACRPSLLQFSEMLLNVRMAEGYTKEQAIKEVEKVITVNKKYIENMKVDGKNIEFFKEEKGVNK